MITDLASVLLSDFTDNPVVEGYPTSGLCSIEDGHPNEIKHIDNTVWKKGDSEVESEYKLYRYIIYNICEGDSS